METKKQRPLLRRGRPSAGSRGITTISVMLIVMSLMTLGLLVVRSSVREARQAGQLLARERALVVAQAAIDLAAARYPTQLTTTQLDDHLRGFGTRSCTAACGDCVPGDAGTSGFRSGQRNAILSSGRATDCNGRPCMRQGAVVQLPDSRGNNSRWCGIPVSDLVPGGDAEATVSLWIRNNQGDALGSGCNDPVGCWEHDNGDGRIVLTATATVRNASVTIEEELFLRTGRSARTWVPQSPDEGYGGGHNNDNAAVSTCRDQAVAMTVRTGP